VALDTDRRPDRDGGAATMYRRPMLSHVSVGVTDLQRALRFYDAVLAPLGYRRVYTGPISAGWGTADSAESFAAKLQARPPAPGPGFHVAFVAPDRQAVHTFHAVALANGGDDEGPPGPRLHYGETYYAAFVCDPDGTRLEAVHQ
jgi:catechol 2,3-dioxygenase-like lactoylglutathione lyase family enzyme